MLELYLKNMSEIFITSHCSINKNSVVVNEKQRPFVGDFSSGIRNIYQYESIKYPKFFKMDNLSKLAFIAAELALSGLDIKKRYESDKIGLILMCSNSSLDTDCRYFESISNENYYPSPGIFVYTLPNLMAGEICIRHNFKGENTVFINDQCDWKFISEIVQFLMITSKIDACLCGWCDLFLEDFATDLFFVEKGDQPVGKKFFNSANILKILDLQHL